MVDNAIVSGSMQVTENMHARMSVYTSGFLNVGAEGRLGLCMDYIWLYFRNP